MKTPSTGHRRPRRLGPPLPATLAQPGVSWGPSSGLLPEAAFEPCPKSLCSKAHAPPGRPARGGRPSPLPFPKSCGKMESASDQFASIWWDSDGTCIGIRKLSQKEILERWPPTKCLKAGLYEGLDPPAQPLWIQQTAPGRSHQMSLPTSHGGHRPILSKMAGPRPCSEHELPGSGCPIRVGGEPQDSRLLFAPQLQFYRSPFFQRDCPHLLVRMKRRVGVKSASRQMESKPEAPASPRQHLEPARDQRESCPLLGTSGSC
uniref:uncharacterized protein LOC118528170 n=1 Tax=Halichoerus grypus TaxID=9711 RepID=UPI0016595B89|nr:uncharacterized protein LOC118528170 [Halichoerus grypus]